MNQLNQPKLLFVLLVLLNLGMFAGCTTEIVRPGADFAKAAEANAKLGLGYMRQGNFEVAMNKLEKALHFDDENISANHYMAELHRRLGENKTADKYYHKAMELSPKDTDIQNNYGVFLCDLGKYTEADKRFKKVLKNPLYTTRSKVYENIAMCAKRKGDLRKAEHNFNKALLMDPRLGKSLLEMAIINYDKGEHVSAYSYYLRFLKVSKHSARSLWMGVLLENKEGNKSKAASYALLLKRSFPQSKEAVLAKRYLDRRKRKRHR